jgi:hypothetical protein
MHSVSVQSGLTFLAAAFLGAGAFLAGDLAGEGGAGAAAGASTFFGASFLAAVFLGAVFFGAVFLAAAFFGAVFFTAGFFGEVAFFVATFFAGDAFLAAICWHPRIQWAFNYSGRGSGMAHLVVWDLCWKKDPIYIVFASSFVFEMCTIVGCVSRVCFRSFNSQFKAAPFLPPTQTNGTHQANSS